MMNKTSIKRIIAITIVFLAASITLYGQKADTEIIVPLGGNGWPTGKDTLGGNIGNAGIINWNNKQNSFVAFVRFARTGTFQLSLYAAVPKGSSIVGVDVLNTHTTVEMHDSQLAWHNAGTYTVKDTGYVAIHIKGVSKTDDIFANIESMKLSGIAVDEHTAYVKNNEGEFFYWGHRGPSVHLGYQVPDTTNAEWFYNEVTVPRGNDVIGSYFMADGFGEGYFGMQVNSATERRILFSVWSPFKTDDPKAIPEDEKILMLKKGDGVHTGEFGSEGSGGQSYLQYNWKAGNTYRFLMHARPGAQNRTEYTAYFYAPEVGKWQLTASFSRPKTNTYLKHLHSFLENFEPEQGTITRMVHFNNEWIRTDKGQWIELTKARFTVDNTGAKGYRMDYAGGTDGNAFYLKNCGFFNHYTVRNTFFDRPAGNKKPEIDFNKLQ